ncbi:MAG: RluA family pseudouridine synthase [Bacteroidetes bacterium]|nr:RluA family pseudouridine synthase [Bacteroidota bacterium]
MNEESTNVAENQEQEYYEHYHFNVDNGQEPLRIDKFLFNRIEKISRNKIQIAAKAGSILVNQKAVKANYKVKPTDDISIVMAEPPRFYELVPEKLPLEIVYEDDDLIIINKQSGLVVHPGYGNYSGTLVHGLLYHFSELPDPDETKIRPGLVHRIDKNTTGLMVVAKNDFAMTHLANQFFEHSIDRTYVALVWGNLEKDKGTIKGHIGRSQKDRKVFTVYEDGEKGKSAITHYKVLQRFSYTTLVECTLETGRTHQIRVHMKYMGHPLFNDDFYGGDRIVKGYNQSKFKQFISNCFKIMPRQALHARTLNFDHPVSGKRMKFDIELPADFTQVIERWDTYISALK